jgi:hypothetical protein
MHILCKLFNQLSIFISLERVTQGRIANNFITIIMVILILNGGVTKTNVVLKLLSFGANNVFCFSSQFFFSFLLFTIIIHVLFTIIVN